MDVDVVCMRFNGAKIPRDRLSAATPVRGELSISTRYDQWGKRHVPVASLRAGTTDALPALDCVRILHLSGPQFVLVGAEASSIRKSAVVYRQAWWCRVVNAAADQARPPSDRPDRRA